MEDDKGNAAVVVPVARAGWARYPCSITIQVDTQTDEVVRLMAHYTRRSAAEILREAVLGKGLAAVAGYESARVKYDAGERVRKASAASSAGKRRATRTPTRRVSPRAA